MYYLFIICNIVRKDREEVKGSSPNLFTPFVMHFCVFLREQNVAFYHSSFGFLFTKKKKFKRDSTLDEHYGRLLKSLPLIVIGWDP